MHLLVVGDHAGDGKGVAAGGAFGLGGNHHALLNQLGNAVHVLAVHHLFAGGAVFGKTADGLPVGKTQGQLLGNRVVGVHG